MFITNDNKKIIYWSKGKLGTTTLRVMLDSDGPLEHLGPWVDGVSFDVTEIDWSKYKDYTIFCPIRKPRDRYVSGIIEDIHNFYKTFTGSRGHFSLNHFNNSNDWENSINELFELFSFAHSDMSFGNSYHVGNWLWEIIYIACKNNNLNVFHISDWDQHYQDHYNLQKTSIEKINEIPTYIKDIVGNIFNKESFLQAQLDFYLYNEEKLYSMILESFVYKTTDFNLVKNEYTNFFHQYLKYFKEKETQTSHANNIRKINELIDSLQNR